jgi:hypothetical protein
MEAMPFLRFRLAHAMLVCPFSPESVIDEAVDDILDAVNRILPHEQRFVGLLHREDGADANVDEDDGVWEIGPASDGMGYVSLRESDNISSKERSALAVANLVSFTFLFWQRAMAGRLLREHVSAEKTSARRLVDLEDLVRFASVVTYTWREDYERKRIVGLCLAANGSSLLRERMGGAGQLALGWNQLFKMYVHEAELWQPVLVEPTKEHDGLVFLVHDEPVGALLAELSAGRLHGSSSLTVAREFLRWICLPEVQ